MLVVESVRNRNKFFIPTIVARLVATNQQDGAAARGAFRLSHIQAFSREHR